MNKKYSLGKEFNHSQAEPLIYEKWERNGHFQPSGEGTPYYIPMPPPNITGQLHAGHALFATIQDILIRYKRQRGYDALWLPGLDHAGLATQEKIEQELQAAGLEINRENFDAMASDWCDRYKDRIIHQLKSIGASADWSRTKFTLDADMCAATTHAFISLYERGLIYYRDGGWYLKMRLLADAAIAKLDAGELKIIPETESKTYRHYLDNIHDWELSRQIWWGHSIPAWQSQETGEWFIAAIEQEAQLQAPGHTLIQSPDKLDTWFSSGLWSFSALGWHTNSEDYQRFFPAATLETGKDILFFWAARQIMLSLELTGKLPFKTIYLHGLIRDSKNQKMSKSKGNGIDPLAIIDKYGADALRFGLAANTTAGQDSKLNEEHFISAAKFTRKIWNAARFILQYELPSPKDKFLITQEDLALRDLIYDLTDEIYCLLDNYKFSLAANRLRQFFWHEFCDRYIESTKKRIESGDNANSAIFMLHESLDRLIHLLHPFMPFITEYIYDQMMDDAIIALSAKDIANYFSAMALMHHPGMEDFLINKTKENINMKNADKTKAVDIMKEITLYRPIINRYSRKDYEFFRFDLNRDRYEKLITIMENFYPLQEEWIEVGYDDESFKAQVKILTESLKKALDGFFEFPYSDIDFFTFEYIGFSDYASDLILYSTY